ncbi:homeobox-leucine zipper protein HOX11-like [Gastrolobium bilobum]|uniref:homeobox-leucine zipper protein HOX11-like n=1 Tax=Gastrolobium bilobum TaxID=150636 RepID=UPI002AAFAD18|nr:homeobox-leucine zipper protein HOX11-like [Gastrolobium bilobum]
MELGLSLGDTSRPFVFIERPCKASNELGLGFNTTLSIGQVITKQRDHQHQEQDETTAKQNNKHNSHSTDQEGHEATNEYLTPSLKANNNAVLPLDLLPHTPAVAPINHPPHLSISNARGLDINRVPTVAAVEVDDEAEEEVVLSSSPNSAASSIQMDLCIFSRGRSMSGEGYDQRGSSKASDEDENGGSTRKKLRLSKEQSAFLEENFKEHNTLNPKQKLALAKQLHLRPRQVEVWFQNRRARTKLKQTEVDCEYLKRCCDTLREENRRIHKEIQELRALKTSNPFYMQLPPTTLTMCPSCERVATNCTAKTTNESTSKTIGFPVGKPRFYPFSHTQPHTHPTSPQHLELN